MNQTQLAKKDPHWIEPSYSYWSKRLYENFLGGGGKPDFFPRWAELNHLPIKKKDAERLAQTELAEVIE
jgi:hypothetical protein